ncbi:MAG: aldo/keto reductase [Bacteroidales bacterium]|nr:aldo/keto reductase [Bacteroidales bacterium]
MFYHTIKDERLSALGFGAMRLPQLPAGSIDRETVFAMVDEAIANGINYFDTAFPYHDGHSEQVLGAALARHPREKWNLADKYPGHQHYDKFDPAGVFECQLRRCGVDYFDFYLFHNICENSIADYMDPGWGILEYFVEQREKGRIRHLGFSCHSTANHLQTILDGPYGQVVEFVQIQLNYLDWSLQDARRKCEIIREHGLPIIVMEPLRGGKLSHLSPDAHARLQALDPSRSDSSWALRWLHGIPEVAVVLSGMSSLEQMTENTATFEHPDPLSERERTVLAEIAEGMKDSVPCTTCRYCCKGCPAELDIPALISEYNDLKVQVSLTPVMRLESLPEDKLPHACLQCGACMQICPQGIHIPDVLAELAEMFDCAPKWSDICVKRNSINKA